LINLKGFGKLSEVFETYTGIRQAASSSVILFIIFLDDVIDYLKQYCVVEPIIKDLHCLLHADDTLVMSTSRDNFVHKCNLLLKIINEKKMKLNYGKSGYMIINGKQVDLKCHLKLTDGWLLYKPSQKYLGVIITDSGLLKIDITSYIDKKNKEINVKLASFVTKHSMLPLPMKMTVVNACVESALLFGCESWSNFSIKSVDVLHRKAIKLVMDIFSNTANDIVYSELGIVGLKPIVMKRQLKFFRKLKQDCAENPTSTISSIFNSAIRAKIPYLKHYIQLDDKFETTHQCYNYYVNEERELIVSKIHGTFIS